MQPQQFPVHPIVIQNVPLALEVQSFMHPVIPFEHEAALTSASFKEIAKNITVPTGAADLRGVTCYHGTAVSEMRSVLQGPKNVGSGYGAEGLYVFLNEPANAAEYACIKTQFKGTPGIMEGKLNPSKPYIVGRIQLTRNVQGTDLLKGIWPADWHKNKALKNFVQANFDILEVCGAESAGLAMSSNKFAVIYQRSGQDTIRWNKVYALTNKPAPTELFSRTLESQRRLPSLGNQGHYPTPKFVKVGLYGLKYGFKLYEIVGLSLSIRRSVASEAKKLPFTSPFDLHVARGVVGGVVHYFSHMLFHIIDPAAASVDPKLMQQTEFPNSQQRQANRQQRSDDLNNSPRTTLYMDEMLEHGVMPRDLPKQSPGAKAQDIDRARKWHKWENNVVETLNRKFGLIKDPHVAEAAFKNFMSYMGQIQIPPDFFSWTAAEQAQWGNNLISKGEACFAVAANGGAPSHSASDHHAPQEGNSHVATPRNQDLSDPLSSFRPDLTNLAPISLNLNQNGWVDPERLSQLSMNLPWSILSNSAGEMIALQTSTAIPSAELDTIQNLPLETPSAVPHTAQEASAFSHRVLLHDINTPAPERPSFRQLAQITSAHFGEGIGGGAGLVCNLGSGASVSLSTTGNDVRTGVSVPLAKGLLVGLGTGLCYTIPIAAVMIVIHQFVLGKDKEATPDRKEEKSAQKEAAKVDNARNVYHTFLGQFERNEIDKNAFIQQVNLVMDQLDRSGGKSAFKAFFDSTILKQIGLDLKKLTEDALVKQEVNEQFVPQLRDRHIKELVNTLQGFSDKKLLTVQEKYQQDALINELSSRTKTEDLEGLQHLDSLANHPVAIALDPQGVAKPKYVKEQYFCGGGHQQNRQKERVKKWAAKLEDAYNNFQNASKNGNAAEMERASKEVFYQLERADGKHDVNLSEYKLQDDIRGGPKASNAYEYYKTYMADIKSNTEQTLARYNAVKTGTVSEANPAYFSPEEIKKWKNYVATSAFNKALNDFNSPSATVAEKDTAFSAMHGAAKVLHGEGVTDPQIQNTLAIGNEYSSYSEFQTVFERNEKISSNLDGLRDASRQMDASPPVAPEEYARLYDVANEHAKKLVELGVSEEDIHQLTDKVTGGQEIVDWIRAYPVKHAQYQKDFVKSKAIVTGLETLQDMIEGLKDNTKKIKSKDYAAAYKKAFDHANKMVEEGLSKEDVLKITVSEEAAQEWMSKVKMVQEGYPNFLRVGEYQDKTLHRFSTPLVRLTLHVLNDLNRTDRPMLNFGIKVLTTANSIAPGVLPAGINRLVAFACKENDAVKAALTENCHKAAMSNVFSALKNDLKNPTELLRKSFNKKATAIQGANAAVQIVAGLTTGCVTYVFEDKTKAEKVNQVIRDVATGVNVASNAVFYANIARRTIKYVKAGELGAKIHKVWQGGTGLALLSLDICEFLATDPAEWNRGQEFVKTVQSYLPTFHGNLPEDSKYYAGKDIAITAGCAIFAASPAMFGLTVFQGGLSLYNLLSDKYTEDVLTAIMINLRYFSKQPPSPEREKSLDKSFDNLNFYLNHSKKVEVTDSPVVQKAKEVEFERRLQALYESEMWNTIVADTEIVFGVPDECKFKTRNIDVFNLISELNKRYVAITNIMAKAETFDLTKILDTLKELKKVSDYLSRRFSVLPKSQLEKTAVYRANVAACFKDIKNVLLKNFLVFYVKGQRDVTPWVALNQFDAIPNEERGIQEWFSLGVITSEFHREFKDKELLELKLFSFETVFRTIEEIEKQRKNLSQFEVELKTTSEAIMRELRGGLSQPRKFSLETQFFTPVLEGLIAEAKRKGKQEQDVSDREKGLVF